MTGFAHSPPDRAASGAHASPARSLRLHSCGAAPGAASTYQPNLRRPESVPAVPLRGWWTAWVDHFQTWTEEQISELRRMAAEGAPVRDIAKALGRTQEVVSARAKAEKLTLFSGRRRPERPSPSMPNALWRPP